MVLQFILSIRTEIFKNFLSRFVHIILNICDSLTISRDPKFRESVCDSFNELWRTACLALSEFNRGGTNIKTKFIVF